MWTPCHRAPSLSATRSTEFRSHARTTRAVASGRPLLDDDRSLVTSPIERRCHEAVSSGAPPPLHMSRMGAGPRPWFFSRDITTAAATSVRRKAKSAHGTPRLTARLVAHCAPRKHRGFSAVYY
ncbi:hypothetical protein DAI22_02g277433 [Oryza sativa Japonica Group]|nr:hypothetical protein DAI22_02g277433 [Oryza sativa Japonica Group]